MRVCFDLDNTLVTYPTTPGDYSTVKPVLSMISLAQKLKSEGHTIIIHTARRMLTHKHNTGAVIKDIGRTTFDTLDKFCIPYDELIFGKPIADIYIDDRSVNPYRDNIDSMGYLTQEEKIMPVNMLPPNKYNTIELQGGNVIKRGPTEFLSGEIFYYINIPKHLGIHAYFPKYISSTTCDTSSKLVIEHIPSIPFYTLFKSELITREHVMLVLEAVDVLHNTKSAVDATISFDDMMLNYIQKLEERFQVKEDYPFADAYKVQTLCLNGLKDYMPQRVDFIHGDLWFSNILVNYKNELKFIDMKGKVNGKYTTGGDKLYDYGKLLQSFLGYDVVLYNDDAITDEYRTQMLELFYGEIDKRGVDRTGLQIVTFSLVVGALHSIKDVVAKQRVWEWINKTFVEALMTVSKL
jgi:capsule biosynthesis phosphatase